MNIALVHHSVPVMGVIYVPVKKELYFGVHDSGAYKKAYEKAKQQELAEPQTTAPAEEVAPVVTAPEMCIRDRSCPNTTLAYLPFLSGTMMESIAQP